MTHHATTLPRYDPHVRGASSSGATAGPTFAGSWIQVTVGPSVFNVVKYGAKGDGVTNDTLAIQAAFDAAAKANGGTVHVPRTCASSAGAGCNYLTSALEVRSSNTALLIDGGATLTVSNDRSKWPAPLNILNCAAGITNLAFVGTGTIDGQGEVWWQHRDDFRPKMLNCQSSNVLVANLTFRNSPNHNLEMYTDDAELVGVKITAPPSTGGGVVSHNTDGVDVHGSPFYIHNCMFAVGDDNVAAHASDLLVEDCTFGTGHGASIGSLGGDVGDLHNITFRGIVFSGTTQALRIKSDAGASGVLHDVYCENLSIHNVGTTVVINMDYTGSDASTSPVPLQQRTPEADGDGGTTLQIRNVYFSNITVQGTGCAGQLACAASSPCHSLEMSNFQQLGVGAPWSCSNAFGTATDVVPKPCI